MIRIDAAAWSAIRAHAEKAYPNECCGAMLGRLEDGEKSVLRAVALDNAYDGSQAARYEIRPEDLLEADRAARRDGLDLIGIYHSHPDCDAYFSQTDLKNSCPWYSFVVVSVRGGRFDHATSWLPNAEQTRADAEPLQFPEEN
ncbi:MAG: Mov34/MPN/PAD-1 family protein [Acidobacteriota bacterium]